MRERAQALGGTFTIRQREGGGTIVAVTLPFGGTNTGTDAANDATMRRAG
jgi:nitrate/nitrite-specific signal transduction histidine kinase